VAERLFDRGGHQLAILPDEFELIRMSEEEVYYIPNEGLCRFILYPSEQATSGGLFWGECGE
jgi:hypothetical protein